MPRAGVVLSGVLVAAAFGGSYALNANGGSDQASRAEIPGRPAAALEVSERALSTRLLSSVGRIPTLSARPAARAASGGSPAASPAPAPAPSSPAPAPVAPAPAPVSPTPTPAPAPAPRPAPAPAPQNNGGPTFDDSG